MQSLASPSRHSVTGSETLGPYTLRRLERGDLEPGAPGQFFMLEAPGRLLPRPFSLCLAPPGELAFLVDPIGPGTEALCRLRAGDEIGVLGPLGHGYRLDVERPLLVGGGIGIAPLPYLAEQLGRSSPAVLGFRSSEHAEAAALLPAAAHRGDRPRDAQRNRPREPGPRALPRRPPAAASRARNPALGERRRLLCRGLRRDLLAPVRHRGGRAQPVLPERRRGGRFGRG